MSSLDLRNVFQIQLPKVNKNFEIREEQIQFAESVEKIMNTGGVLAAEAGTGIGKSFAYLVPAIKQALNGQQVVVVTATIALQHQLADKDIPQLLDILNVDLPVTVLKGRSNYVCKSRMRTLLDSEDGLLFKNKGISELADWQASTETGDREEYGASIATEENNFLHTDLWKEVCTHEYSCGGRRCQERGNVGCFYIKARQSAKQAKIIVTNYNLLAYHLMLQQEKEELAQEENEGSLEGLLPDSAIFVLDEAHNLKDIMRRSKTISLSRTELATMFESLFGKRGVVTIESMRRGGLELPIQTLLDNIKQNFEEALSDMDKIDGRVASVHQNLEQERYASEVSYATLHRQDVDLLDRFRNLSADLQAMADTIDGMQNQFSEDDSVGESLRRSMSWWSKMSTIAYMFSLDKKEEQDVLWAAKYGKSTNYVYSYAPLFVDEFLNQTLFAKSKSVICTSATLTVGSSFDHWMRECGVPQHNTTLQLPSPFPYHTNVLMAVPTDAPEVSGYTAKDYEQYLANLLPKVLDISEGRALILCTSYSMLNTIASALQKLEARAKWNVLVQEGNSSKSKLSDNFRKDAHSVLVATASFWEGFDAPGDTLKMLIITRLPFPNPSNLFVKEETQFFQARGHNPFSMLSVPETALKLRQGFGRLMRSATDSGVVFITDKRLYTKHYGKTIIESLPKCLTRVDSTAAVLKEITAHLKAV